MSSICAGSGCGILVHAPFKSQVGADTVVTLNGADILTLKNIASGTLVADDFQFV